jgi:alkylation response protein AidB-like acyl-CoA dehydrogenase
MQRERQAAAEDPDVRRRVAALEIELMALEITVLRVSSNEAAGWRPGPEASILKIKGTEIQQAITELLVEAVGPYAAAVRHEADGSRRADHAVTGRRCRAAGRLLLQLPQDLDLRRLQRDPEKHHQPDDPGTVRRHAT